MFLIYDVNFSVFCWMHGFSYVAEQLRDQVGNCSVKGENNFKTAFYIYLPFALVLLHELAKLPFWVWKRLFENNLMGFFVYSKMSAKNTALSFKVLRCRLN